MICNSYDVAYHLINDVFITDPILIDDVNNIAKHMDKLHPSTIEQLTSKLGIALDPKLMSKPSGWAVPLAILVELEKKGCEEPEVLSKRHFARKLAETANEIQSKEDKNKLRNVVRLLDDGSEYIYCTLSYLIFLFLVLAIISSHEEESVTEKYVHQHPVEEATTQ